MCSTFRRPTLLACKYSPARKPSGTPPRPGRGWLCCDASGAPEEGGRATLTRVDLDVARRDTCESVSITSAIRAAEAGGGDVGPG